MDPTTTLQLLALLVMLGLAVVSDLRERRIPNRVTVWGAGVGLVLSALVAGGIPTSALWGVVVALGLSLPAFALGVLGAGDAKLLAAVAAFVGLGALPSVLLYGGLAGGILGLASSIQRGTVIPVLLNLPGTFVYVATLGRRGARQSIQDPNARTIPYGVAIAAGAVAAWFFPLSLGASA
jgi:prepilin peptidase CpaA